MKIKSQHNNIHFIKRLMDIVVSILLIVILFPILLIISLLIKSTLNGPILFKQERVGRLGQRFTIYKFR